jgi:hypothetical protein
MVDQEEGPAVTLVLVSNKVLLTTKANSRITQVGTHHPKNKTGRPFQMFYNSNERLVNHKATPVFLYHGIWHSIRLKDGQAIVGIPLSTVHSYDEDETATEEVLLRGIDLQIRDSLIQLPQTIQATLPCLHRPRFREALPPRYLLPPHKPLQPQPSPTPSIKPSNALPAVGVAVVEVAVVEEEEETLQHCNQ